MEMDSEDFLLLWAEYQREPWGEWRTDFAFGVLNSTIANYAGKIRESKKPPAKPIEFMPFYQPDPEPLGDDIDALKQYLGK